MRALQDLENAASGDAAVHQRIASLPVEVQEVSLLDKITGKKRSVCDLELSGSQGEGTAYAVVFVVY